MKVLASLTMALALLGAAAAVPPGLRSLGTTLGEPAPARGTARAPAAGASDSAVRAADGRVIHVDDSGSDGPGCGGESRPCRTIQAALRGVAAGDTIRVHAGDYDLAEPLRLTGSGTPGRPIVLMGAGDGAAVIRYAYQDKPCGSTPGPTFERAIKTPPGADYWIIRDLHIVGGIFVQAKGILSNKQDFAGVQSTRKPGLRGQETYQPEDAEELFKDLDIDPADSIQILDNDIRGIGIITQGMRRGLIEGNDIHDINCWSGGGMWIGKFTRRTTVRNNHVHDINPNKKQHYMVEGIRLGNGASYNTIEKNLVERIGGAGRGISADVHANWNVYRNNIVRQAAIGFSEQEGNRGNQWVNNLAEDNRRWNYHFGFGKNGSSDESANKQGLVECNASREAGRADVGIQAVNGYVFRNNQFATVELKDRWRSEWDRVGNNTWNGSPAAPAGWPMRNSTPGFGSCPPLPPDVGIGGARRAGG